MALIELKKSKKIFDCKRFNEENGENIIVCMPIEKLPNGEEVSIGRRPVKFKIEGKSAILDDDGGIDIETLKELDEHLRYFLR